LLINAFSIDDLSLNQVYIYAAQILDNVAIQRSTRRTR